jgi:hypothetical protein
MAQDSHAQERARGVVVPEMAADHLPRSEQRVSVPPEVDSRFDELLTNNSGPAQAW